MFPHTQSLSDDADHDDDDDDDGDDEVGAKRIFFTLDYSFQIHSSDEFLDFRCRKNLTDDDVLITDVFHYWGFPRSPSGKWVKNKLQKFGISFPNFFVWTFCLRIETQGFFRFDFLLKESGKPGYRPK